MKKIKLFVLMVGVICATSFATELPALFADNMVLQQNSNAKFWGKAIPGHVININASWGKEAFAKTDANGKWMCDLPTPSAGGPYTITIHDVDSTIELKNVLIGEVWFCSGQSNMEMPLQGWPPHDVIQNSDQEIEQANFPNIRLFTVARNASLTLQEDVTGTWQECNPETAKTFSATAYFFGRKLYKELNVPIGLIHSSWGGTPAQAWMDKDHLQAYANYKAQVDQIDASIDKVALQQAWLAKIPQISVNPNDGDDKWAKLNFNDQQIPSTNFDDSKWQVMTLPKFWEQSAIGQFDGVVWFRKNVDLRALPADKELVIELGPIDDMDETYLNGVKIGSHMKEGFWEAERKYKIPANLVKKGENTIAIKVVDNQGGGGIYGTPGEMKIYTQENPDVVVPLAGDWKYLPIAEYKNARFYVFNIEKQQFYERPKVPVESNPDNPTTLFNGMVHPVVPFTIKGVIWYQGEANVNNPKQYESLFPDLIKNWRDVWGEGDFPFYFVQIAPWNYGESSESQMLRDAQRKALKLKNTGMAVTVDIGDSTTIHPADKQDVGKRLALWALAKNYNKEMVFSGPLYESMNIEDDKIILSFEYSDGGLMSPEGENLNNFIIAGANKKFKNAHAQIEGDHIVVSSPDIKNPVAVRYLWDNTSYGTLFNAAGLPASSFRTDNW